MRTLSAMPSWPPSTDTVTSSEVEVALADMEIHRIQIPNVQYRD